MPSGNCNWNVRMTYKLRSKGQISRSNCFRAKSWFWNVFLKYHFKNIKSHRFFDFQKNIKNVFSNYAGGRAAGSIWCVSPRFVLCHHVIFTYCAAWILKAISFQVLDEIYCILKSVRVNPNPPRAHELLQELRDISSMAMEHFDEKIAPNLRDRVPEASELRLILSARSSGASRSSPPSSLSFRGRRGRTL